MTARPPLLSRSPAGGRAGRRSPLRPSSSPGWALSAFLVVAVLALVVVSGGVLYASERIARRGALAEAEVVAVRISRYLVAPVLPDVLAGQPGRRDELARRVENRLRDDSVSAVRVYDAAGRILFSSVASETGRTVAPGPELRSAIDDRTVGTVVDAPGGGDGARELDVFAPLRSGEDDLAVAVSFPYGSIDRQAARLRADILPLAVGGMLLLQLVQVPIAVSLFRRVRSHEVERAGLLERSIRASDRERRAIAGDVHDGPVQDLAGVSYALSALRGSVAPERRGRVDVLVATVQDAVQSLRTLMVDIYPPDLSGAGLGIALDDLTARAQDAGIKVVVDVEPTDDLPQGAAAALYRTAKEALANVVRHSGAGRVDVRLGPAEPDGVPAVRLEIADDGVGLPDEVLRYGSPDGHLGLRLMRDRMEDVGGTLDIVPRAGGGTSVVAVVPSAPPADHAA